MKKLFTLLLPILLSLNLLSGCNINPKNSKQQFERFNFYFDTIINIIVYNEDEVPYIDECFQLAQKYEELFSATKSGSDIWNINANAGSFVEVDEETIFLIEKALEYGSLSDGLFTITIGPLSKLWNISELSKTLDKSEKILDTSYLPSKDKITSALTHIGDNLIEINGNKVRLTDASASIDLGGIAKGYIADKMKELLENNHVTSGIINLGGNIMTLGEKPNGSAYKLGIQKPFAETGKYIATIEITNQSVVSSGNYERYFKVNDTIYHHILNPKTGYPTDNNLYGVTIISDSSVAGDALSTTCFALGLEKGLELIESLENVEAVFITDKYEIFYSSGIGTDIPFKQI